MTRKSGQISTARRPNSSPSRPSGPSGILMSVNSNVMGVPFSKTASASLAFAAENVEQPRSAIIDSARARTVGSSSATSTASGVDFAVCVFATVSALTDHTDDKAELPLLQASMFLSVPGAAAWGFTRMSRTKMSQGDFHPTYSCSLRRGSDRFWTRLIGKNPGKSARSEYNLLGLFIYLLLVIICIHSICRGEANYRARSGVSGVPPSGSDSATLAHYQRSVAVLSPR